LYFAFFSQELGGLECWLESNSKKEKEAGSRVSFSFTLPAIQSQQVRKEEKDQYIEEEEE
jgi:hypothetical protein